jgi:hypothetical protein
MSFCVPTASCDTIFPQLGIQINCPRRTTGTVRIDTVPVREERTTRVVEPVVDIAPVVEVDTSVMTEEMYNYVQDTRNHIRQMKGILDSVLGRYKEQTS